MRPLFSKFNWAPKSGILTIPQVQKSIFGSIFLIYVFKGLFCMQKGISREEVDGLCLVDLELVLDDHDQFEDGEGLEDEDSA